MIVKSYNLVIFVAVKTKRNREGFKSWSVRLVGHLSRATLVAKFFLQTDCPGADWLDEAWSVGQSQHLINRPSISSKLLQ